MRRILPPAIFIGLVCLLLWPVVFQGRVLLPGGMLHGMLPWSEYAGKGREIDWIPLCWDSLAQYLPERMLLGQAIRSGELPLWNPYKMCGVPFLADPQTAVLYPPNLLYAFVPPDLAFTILAIVHLVGAGLFTYIFVRGLGLSRTSSVFAGVAFMLSGFGIVWLELPVFMSSGVWLPLALHLMRLACEKRSPLHAAGAGITLALSLVGGHPQIALYTWLLTGLYWVCLLASTNNKRTVGAMIGLGFLAFGIGAALAAPQLLPSFELASVSHRGGSAPTNLGYIAYVSRAMPIWRSIVLIAPDFFGNPSKGGMWVGGEYAEYCGYVGILPLLLILIAFLAKGKRIRDACFFGFVFILALLLSMGAPICRVLYFLVPGFSHSGSPARALFLFCFAASVLASLGLQQLFISRNENSKRTRVTIILSTIAIMIALGGLWLANAARFAGDQPYATVFWELLSSVYLPLTFLILGTFLLLLVSTSKIGYKVGQLIIIAVLSVDMLSFGMWYNPMARRADVYPRTKVTDFLLSNTRFERVMPLNAQWSLSSIPRVVLPPNSPSVYGLFDVSGYGTLYPVRYKELLDKAAGGDSSPPESGNMVFARNADSPLYNLLGVRWVISPEPLSNADRKIGNCWIHKKCQALRRAFLVRTVEFADEEEILRRLANGQTDFRYVALATLDDKVSFGRRSDKKHREASGPESVAVARYSFNTVELKVNARRRSLLVLTDQYYPGWKAFVDGTPSRVMRVDYVFRAVAVPAGKHIVSFKYAPESYKRGLRVAAVALLVILYILVYSTVSLRRVVSGSDRSVSDTPKKRSR